jgi:hypothetical protein
MTLFRRIIVLVSAATLAAAVPIGMALAADSRLDLADDHIEKAIALVNASQNPNAKDPDRPFGGHDDKAIKLLEAAREEIAKAKAYADDPKNWASSSSVANATAGAKAGVLHDSWVLSGL